MRIVKTKKSELEAIKSARQAPESKRRVSRSRLSSHKKHYSSEVWERLLLKIVVLGTVCFGGFNITITFMSHSIMSPSFILNFRLQIYNTRIVKVRRALKKNMIRMIHWLSYTVMCDIINQEYWLSHFCSFHRKENILTIT